MPDCRNEEMRDLLPDFAADRLSGQDAVRVAAHVAECPECAADVVLLQQARQALAGVVAGGRGLSDVDVHRIVAALPKPPAAVRPAPAPRLRAVSVRPSGRMPWAGRRTTWTAWRLAAAVSTIAVGGLSVAVVRGTISSRGHGPLAQHGGGVAAVTSPSGSSAGGSAAVESTASSSTPAHGPGAVGVTGAPSPGGVAATAPTESASGDPTAAAAGGLAVAGNISDLSDGEVESLLQDVDALDAAPSDEPEPAAPGLHGVAAQ